MMHGLQPFCRSGDFCRRIVNPKKLETGLRTNSAGIPYTLLLRIEANHWVSNFWASTVVGNRIDSLHLERLL